MTKDPAERFVLNTMEGINLPDCFTCLHFRRNARKCAAYPEGIPKEIIQGRATHREVRPDQVGHTIYTPEP